MGQAAPAEIYLVYDQWAGWKALSMQSGYPAQIASGPSMEFVIQNAAAYLGMPVAIKMGAAPR